METATKTGNSQQLLCSLLLQTFVFRLLEILAFLVDTCISRNGTKLAPS